MQISGKPHEGWMTVIPVTVFAFIVTAVLGGPTAFVNIIGAWFVDLLAAVAHWFKYLL